MNPPAIAVVPYEIRIGKDFGRLPLDRLDWPLGCPERLAGKQVSDLEKDDHLIAFARTALHFQPRWHGRAKLSIMVMEPKIMSARHHRLLGLTHRRFFRVFTYDPDLVTALPNAAFLPFGTTWVPHWPDLDLSKSREVSLIASAKRDHPGHKLRHDIVGVLKDSGLDAGVLGRGYAPFEDKAEGLAPYRYSVVIENVREPNYFSEKLIDAVLCETVPIYWGCPNLDDFLDISGMIVCRSRDEIVAALTQAGPQDYAARLPALRRAKEQAVYFGRLSLRAAEGLRDSL